LSAPVSFIADTLIDVNNEFDRGRPSFAVNRGYVMYEAKGFPFVLPRKLAIEKARREAQQHRLVDRFGRRCLELRHHAYVNAASRGTPSSPTRHWPGSPSMSPSFNLWSRRSAATA